MKPPTPEEWQAMLPRARENVERYTRELESATKHLDRVEGALYKIRCSDPNLKGCQANDDGECDWEHCPQRVEYQGNGCPRWLASRSESE